MSLAKLLDHLHTGDVIIVRNAALQLRSPAAPARVEAVDASTIKSRKLVRNLIAVRKDGGKK